MAPLGHPLRSYYGSVPITDADRIRVREVFRLVLMDVYDSGSTEEMIPPFAAIVHWVLRNRQITTELAEQVEFRRAGA